MNDEKKLFSDFLDFFWKYSLGEKNVEYFGKSEKNFFYWKKIRLQVSKWGVFCDQKSFSDFLDFFLEMKFRRKKCAVFWKICKKLFFSGKNPTLSFKKVGILVKIPYGKSTLF